MLVSRIIHTIPRRWTSVRYLSSSSSSSSILLTSEPDENGVVTVTMNRPSKLNGWSPKMLSSLLSTLESLNENSNASAVVLTGTGDYYCAGVDLSGSFELGTPQNTFNKIVESNRNGTSGFLSLHLLTTSCSNICITFFLSHRRLTTSCSHIYIVFDTFLDFEKPLIVACNGHAIGASVTSATLCDAIVAASPDVTFTTPFGRLGISPEGCSSVRRLCLSQ